MTFSISPLQEPLQSYIESIFHFKDFMPDHSIERVVPTGHAFLIFELDGFPRHTFDNDSLEVKNTFTKVWLSGMHRNYISISAHPKSEMLVVQFKAYGVYPFMTMSVQEVSEKVQSAVDIFGEEILEVRKSILASPTVHEKFSVIQTWLQQRFNSSKIPSPEFLTIFNILEKESKSAFQQALENYAFTPKHFIHQFKKYVGLTPKYYQRILRFNEIFQKIQQQEKISWSQVAYSCGYADQSHFIKEFKHFSGFNPQHFIQQDFHEDETNFFPLDRIAKVKNKSHQG